jgi:hypothetical protein
MRIDPINSSTFKIAHSQYAETEIGDIRETVFRPHIKCKRWGGESWFSLLHSVPENVSPVMEGNILKWIRPQIEIWFYSVDSFELGGMEFEIILKNKPPINTITLPIDFQNCEFLYQPPLTPEEIARGDIRPENVVGSYAIYSPLIPMIGRFTKEERLKYGRGKVGHLYTMKAISANLQTIWLGMVIDSINKTLTFNIDQAFLDSATYPIRIDPTIGYETVGGSNQNLTDYLIGEVGTTDANGGTVSLLSACGFELTETGHPFKGAIYTSGGTLITNGASNQRTNITTNQVFHDFTFATAPILAPSTSYIPVLWADDAGASGTPRMAYDAGGGTIGRYYGQAYNGFPTPITFDTIDRRYSVHVDYAPAGGPDISIKRIVLGG